MVLWWLHESCEWRFGIRFVRFGANNSCLKVPLSKSLQNRRFSAWALRSGFVAAICVDPVRNSIVLCSVIRWCAGCLVENKLSETVIDAMGNL